MVDMKQQYDEINEDGKVVNSYVLPRPVEEMKEEIAGLLKEVKRD